MAIDSAVQSSLFMRPDDTLGLVKKVLLVAALFLLFTAGAWRLANARTFQLFGEIVPRVETECKVVALTFDDGPRPDTVDEILTALGREKATFFVCGAEMSDAPGVAEKLVAAGHELGNHSYSHPRFLLKSSSFIREEFGKTDALIRAAGHRGPIHVRAPYCKKLVALPWYFKQTKRTHVTWDVEPETYTGADRDAARITKHVLDHVKPGSIVLLHPWYRGREGTRAAVPRIVAGLKARGYELVTVDELLRMR